uniref:Ig-like domain-containing protein n=1 Tax=Astatotilapia calliptera TaxID=8154 RepID=A0A3P8NJ75_ASTCA
NKIQKWLYFICYCSDEQTFETKTVYVGENINLTCPRRDVGTLFWLKLVSGDFPKILGRSFSSQSADQRIRTVTDPGIFDLYITKAQQSDTGVYICMKTSNRELTFLNGTYLKVEDYTVVQSPLTTVQEPGNSVTFLCSVFSDSDKKTCPRDLTVLWFRAGSHKNPLHPSIIYTDGNRHSESERISDSEERCLYRFSKNVSSSDAGTYYCAVVTCGEILFGNGTKLDIEVQSTQSGFIQMTILIVCLAISLFGNVDESATDN